jgi:hypothetical protein
MTAPAILLRLRGACREHRCRGQLHQGGPTINSISDPGHGLLHDYLTLRGTAFGFRLSSFGAWKPIPLCAFHSAA